MGGGGNGWGSVERAAGVTRAIFGPRGSAPPGNPAPKTAFLPFCELGAF